MPSSRRDMQKLLSAIEDRLIEVERQLLSPLPKDEYERLIELAAGLQIVRRDTLRALTGEEPPEDPRQGPAG
jgi:hypothetical protein